MLFPWFTFCLIRKVITWPGDMFVFLRVDKRIYIKGLLILLEDTEGIQVLVEEKRMVKTRRK